MKINFKQCMISFLLGSIFFGSVGFAASEIKQAYYNDTIKIQVDGKAVNDIQAITIVPEGTDSGITCLPLRKTAELLGCTIEWNGDTKTANIVTMKEEVSQKTMTTDTTIEPTVTSSEKQFITYKDCAAIIYKNETYVQVTDLHVKFKVSTNFNPKDETITLSFDGRTIALDTKSESNAIIHEGKVYAALSIIKDIIE